MQNPWMALRSQNVLPRLGFRSVVVAAHDSCFYINSQCEKSVTDNASSLTVVLYVSLVVHSGQWGTAILCNTCSSDISTHLLHFTALPQLWKGTPQIFGSFSCMVIQLKFWAKKMQEYKPIYIKIFWRVNDIYSVGLDFTSFNVLSTCDTEEFKNVWGHPCLKYFVSCLVGHLVGHC